MNVEIGTFRKDFDAAPLFKGLPDDISPTPAWGYVLKGSVRVTYKDREEITNAGDVFYSEPGHTMRLEAGTEYGAFSPAEEFEGVISIVDRNAAKKR
ncbi:MAG: AraC family ligand binding domain-containing protein [Halobacteriota archaeon]